MKLCLSDGTVMITGLVATDCSEVNASDLSNNSVIQLTECMVQDIGKTCAPANLIDCPRCLYCPLLVHALCASLIDPCLFMLCEKPVECAMQGQGIQPSVGCNQVSVARKPTSDYWEPKEAR